MIYLKAAKESTHWRTSILRRNVHFQYCQFLMKKHPSVGAEPNVHSIVLFPSISFTITLS